MGLAMLLSLYAQYWGSLLGLEPLGSWLRQMLVEQSVVCCLAGPQVQHQEQEAVQ